ncbi:protein of unknown function (DUF4126) [Mariprofundus ferrinatatus]|uniref:DUF4126 domain-containing protein n=1 Tax=Mariprofundus ferrinatatus TaxID=1921087 RepID=A0A2K8L8D9_9PROT|nr:DUF4126 domain-containing protein [Mariprofundus ferrinatatus]ATX81204.1 protein of unknown function (DUF4126) [Mariprofundus ferrinatatus]
MEQLDQIAAVLALTMGAAWASGINLYAAILVLGLMGSTGSIDLPPGLEILSDPLVLFAAGAMYFVEFFADKIPGVDTGWDLMHTFVRIPAGAMMAAGAVGEVDPVVGLAAAILGGGLAATTHAAKAGSRALINTSPEPFSNWTASILEDVAVVAGLWTALNHPTLFLALMLAFIVLMIWLLPKLWRGIKLVFRKLRTFFGGKEPEPKPEAIGPIQQAESNRESDTPQVREP